MTLRYKSGKKILPTTTRLSPQVKRTFWSLQTKRTWIREEPSAANGPSWKSCSLYVHRLCPYHRQGLAQEEDRGHSGLRLPGWRRGHGLARYTFFLLAMWETRIYFVFNLSVPFSMKTRSSKKTKRTTAPTTVRPPPKKKGRRGKTKGAKVISRILYVRKRRT